MTKEINIALVGYGYAGKTFHAPLIANTSGLNLAAIISSDSAKVLEDFPHMFIFPKIEHVLENQQIDAIVIATPNTTHFKLAHQCLQSGKHVIVDKPFTLTTNEAQSLFATADKTKKHLSVFQNRRWDSDFLTLSQILSKGMLGEVMSFQSNFDRYRPIVKLRWREQSMPGSGLWYDLGSHLVDQVVKLFGAPDTVYADLGMQRANSLATDYFHVLLTYGKARIILHSSSLVKGRAPRFAVHGTEGSFVKFGLDVQENQLRNGEKIGGENWGKDPEEGTIYTGDNGCDKKSVPNIPGNYGAYYQSMRDTIQKGTANPVSSIEALTVMSILELASRSSELGTKLVFDRSNVSSEKIKNGTCQTLRAN